MAVAVPNLNLQIVQDQKTVPAVANTQEINGQEFENVFSKVKERTSSENKSNAVQPQATKQESKQAEKSDVKNDEKKVEEASSSVLLQVPDVSLITPQYENNISGIIYSHDTANSGNVITVACTMVAGRLNLACVSCAD